MTFGFLVCSKKCCKLFCVSWEVFVLHGYDWIHWVAKPCTTTAYRWLFQDSQPSPTTLWSAVVKSPTNVSALGTTAPVRLLQEALVIFVLKQISRFQSSGKWVKMWCLLGTTFARGFKGYSWEELEHSRCPGTLSSINPSLNSCSQSGTPYNSSSCNSSSSFSFGFSISVRSCHEFPLKDPLPRFHFFLLLELPCQLQFPAMKMLDKSMKKKETWTNPGTTNGTWLDVSQWIFLAFLMRRGFWPLLQR